MGKRHFKIDKVKAVGGKATFVGINSNYGDTVTMTNSCVSGTKTICGEFEGNSSSAEPKSIGEGPRKSCNSTAETCQSFVHTHTFSIQHRLNLALFRVVVYFVGFPHLLVKIIPINNPEHCILSLDIVQQETGVVEC
jgi:hypothetical protein